ncbi:Ran-specific GTPase-activating protein 30 [Scheffersomyces amazonensis]|uniref:Ran-specific GTPase-activating protein 30 n=1 Tax=Scheffersomyces amazonensis TaxID=1078765 RepID=UPI00315D5355
MDQILMKASNQAVSFAIRSGISLASGYAIKTISQFLDKIPEHEKNRITTLKNRIQIKINIISLSIDLIKLASCRGNSTLESTMDLINELNSELDSFDENVDHIIKSLSRGNEKDSIKKVENYMNNLLHLINDSIPLLNLALITSGININGFLNGNEKVSPGRLIQASNYLIKSNEYDDDISTKFNRVGPIFDLVTYTIFYNPSRDKYVSEDINESHDNVGLTSITWKETFARSEVRIICAPHSENKIFQYKLEIKESFNDGRYHEDEELPQVKTYDVKLVQRLFFSASGKLLRLEGRNSPVLILKLVDGESEEWIALGQKNVGEFEEDEDEDEEEEEEEEPKEEAPPKEETHSSLSLLEYILRLSKLQQIEQVSISQVKDEILSLYLRDESESSVVLEPPITKPKHTTTLAHDSNIARLQNLTLDK